MREQNQLNGWSSDENEWNEKLYPVWKRGDMRWRNSWKGGRVQAVLTSDSPALVGSNITFVVNLVFPRCQKEDADGNIVFEKNCRNGGRVQAVLTSDSPALVGSNITFVVNLVFPRCQKEDADGNIVFEKNCRNGHYFQKLGRCSVRASLNTANVTLGPQVMEVTVYRRHGRAYVPIAQVKDVYVVTDQIPVFVTMSQKNNRNSSDETFLRDLPIVFNVLIHDPSHFLNESAISYKWNFGDNTGLFVSKDHTLNHTYVLNGTFNFNLTVQATVPGPCPPPSPTPPKPTSSLVMEVTVYRRHGRAYVPIAQVKDVYVVTDQIPVFVTMSQKNNRNSSDETFLRDLPIVFNVLIHDPSHFLNESAISYKWNFGDNTGLFVSKDHTLNHTYVLNGTFNFNLTVQATVPGPCPPPSPTPPKPTSSLVPAGDSPPEQSKTSDGTCQINRYGYFRAIITIVEGILEVNIIQMTDVPQPDGSLMDFVVTCQGTTPTEVCTVISDPTCQMAQDAVCDPVAVDGTCLLTVRRAFNGSGMYCVNLTLGDDASLALTSTLISVPGRDSASPSRMVNGALISMGCLALFVTVITLLVYKRHKEYKPIENSTGNVAKGKGLNVFLIHAKAMFFPGNQEKDPLLKNQPGIL
ncbi:Transmembrane glycoprotein NMB [Tupaia chinensis]|uniref:Transmembrane glycoprotein NMB n=1 Tax=Tupaia chinensis TaxID=246437 RepID=L9L2I7_TUPCH|nr:Transmembrane glycoprotein NMB [Tupaia chinensis]